jgi:hypothetical protein
MAVSQQNIRLYKLAAFWGDRLKDTGRQSAHRKDHLALQKMA